MQPQQPFETPDPNLPQPPASPVPPVAPRSVTPEAQEVISHVTARPEAVRGHNYDPQLRVQYANEPSVVHATREIDPPERPISPEVRARHEQSVKDYPFLNLSEGEYVVLNIQRHPIGLFTPIATGMLVVILLLSLLALYPAILAQATYQTALPSLQLVALCIIPVCLLAGLFSYIAVWVYLRNQFFLTNESVVQEIQHSLFSRHEQTVSLGSIEDASFVQTGVLQTMFNYGSIRLSTEGEETTYRFHYVARPKEQVAILSNAVEAFKNGRPVE